MKVLAKAALSLALIASVSSCNIYKKYETPTSTPVTKAYAEAKDQVDDPEAYGNLPWEQVFTDPVLADLINRALANNTDLRNAQLNVEAARAQVLGAKLAYLPSVALAPNGAGSHFNGIGQSGLSWSYQLPAQVSWEIDIFGKLLNSKRGAQATLLRTEAYAHAVRSQIIAAVATTYYTLAATNDQLALSRKTVGLWDETVQTMKDLKLAGTVTEAAVVQAEANSASLRGSITDLEAGVVKLNNAMSLLLNEMPREWEVSPLAALTAPHLSDNGGVPMSYLAARPDVTAAEQALAVAYYATNSARAAFYPGLNITANGGFTNQLGSMIKNPGEFFINLAGSLTAPIFSRGRNIANLKATKAQQQAAMNSFEYALLNAASEVSNALTVYDKSVEKQAFLATQVEKLDKAVEYTGELLKYNTDGRTTYLEVLTAQQSLLAAQISQIACRQAGNLAVINLYQSVGGGR